MNKWKSPRVKKAGLILGFVLVFALGLGIGNGKIALGREGAFGKEVSGLPADMDYSGVEELYDALRKDFDGKLTVEQLQEGLKDGLAGATGDEYTEYFNEKESNDFDADLNGTFSGIGAELSKDQKTIIVVSPIAGYPAEKAGLQPRDIIAEINGESAYDITVSEAVNKIRGPENTKVKLKILRGDEPLDFEITRQKITIPSVETQTLDGNIGYMKISRFAEDTTALSEKAARDFKQAGVKGVILDLRTNPGGLLDSSVDVSSLWLPKGKTVLQEKRDGVVVKTYSSNGRATLAGVPTIVLIDEGSASASEITAGALKDNGAATLLGVKSFGKGSVQHLAELPGGGTLKVTIAKWFTPNGKNIHKEGIEPDQKVERSLEDIKNQRDPQKDEAANQLRKQ